MNRRKLKKSIRYTCGEVISESAFASAVIETENINILSEAIVDAVRLQANALKKASVSFDRQPKSFGSRAEYRKAHRAYYKKAYAALADYFNKELAEIVKKMNSALPAAEE